MGIMAMGEQLLAQCDDSLEALVGLNASQAEGRSFFEGQQVAGMTEQLCDDGISHSDIRVGGDDRLCTGALCVWSGLWVVRQ